MNLTWTSCTIRGVGKILFKSLLFMKITGILLTVACMHVGAASFSQKISLSATDVPLEKVFSLIEEQSGYYFFYRYQEVQQALPVSLDVKNVSIEQVLDICLKNQPFTWSREGKTIVVSMKPGGLDTPVPPIRQREITGTVSDSTGLPLPGVTVDRKSTRLNSSH